MRTLCFLLATLAACSSKSAPPIVPDEYIVDCDQLSADGGTFASDENWDAYLNALAANQLMVNACEAPVLSAPANGATISASAPPTFTFAATPAICRGGAAPAPAVMTCNRPPAGPPSLWSRAGDLLEGTAEAHCGAFTGENYFFHVLHGTDLVYLAVLSTTSFTPTAAIWQQKLSSVPAGDSVTVVIDRAVFFRGDISEGPYTEVTSSTFTVGP